MGILNFGFLTFLLLVIGNQGLPYDHSGFHSESLSDLYSDEGELAEVTYSTQEKSEYHIIQIKIPSFGVPFSVHLIKTDFILPDLSVHHGGKMETEVDLQHCIFQGIVVDYLRGTASLSNCGDHPGFSGHIVVGEHHLYIEPVPAMHNSSDGKTSSRFHKVYRVEELMKRNNNSIVDALQPPPDVLKKALEKMKAFKPTVTEREGDEDDVEDATGDEEDNETDSNMAESAEANADSLLEGDDSKESNFISETLAVTTKKKAKQKAATKKKTNKKKPAMRYAKYIVDIAVFTDVALMESFKKRMPKNTVQKMKLFILNLINNMNLLYRQPSLGTDIGFRLVLIEVLDTIPPGMEPESAAGESANYLMSFCQYATTKNTNTEKWDHALLMTGTDLVSGGTAAVIGLAWYGAMCSNDLSCSVSEGFSFGTGVVLTHEMGHNLGITHDGEGNNGDCNPETNIMSPSTGPGKITWSACSARNIAEFVISGNSRSMINEPDRSEPTCITRPSTLKSTAIRYSKNKLPGQVYTADLQCQYNNGKDFVLCKLAHNICEYMYCESSAEPGNCFGAHPALEGTECETGKYCRAGQCVAADSKQW